MLKFFFKSNFLTHKQRCEHQEITAIKTPNESHLFWKKYFHKNPLYFRICADFEADNKSDASFASSSLCRIIRNIGIFGSANKTINIYKQNTVGNGY